jgi:hypothetical protein
MNKRPASEATLVGMILQHLLAGDHLPAAEVRSHGRASTDVCYLNAGELIGIEAKLADWRRAVGQAFLNRQCVDRSYVALWHEGVRDAVLEEAMRYGVGVIGVREDSLLWMAEAPVSAPDPIVRSSMLESIRCPETRSPA